MTPETTLNALLERAAGCPGHGLRFSGRGRGDSFFEWSEIHKRATAAGGAVQALGVGPGDRVALILPTGIDFFDAFFGVLLSGAVPAPLYPPVRLGRLDEYTERTAAMLRAVGARLVLTDRRVGRVLGEAVEMARPALGCHRMEDLARSPLRPVATRADDLGLVQFSSGTTFDPKPVALSQRALVAQTRLLNSFWPERPGRVESGVSWLPLYHDMGLIGCVFPALERPGTLTLIPPEVFVARPAIWLETVSHHRATISPAPNFAYGLCVDKIEDDQLEGIDLSSWRVALNGAEPVAPEVLRAFQDRFAPWGFRAQALTPVYGLSEAALAVTFSDIDAPFSSRRFDRDALAAKGVPTPHPEGRELVSVGRPLPGFELKIVDENGLPVDPCKVGRLLVKGPSLMQGYLAMPETTEQVLVDGWLDTGDLGFLDDGELFVTGRAKDVLILRGRNHAPEDVEQATQGISGVRRGCVVAASWLPQGAPHEVLVVLAEAVKGTPPAEYADIEKDCRRIVVAATGLMVEHCAVLPPGSLPRTSSGKLRRRAALAQWLEGTLSPPNAVTPLRLAGAVARSTLAHRRIRQKKRHGR